MDDARSSFALKITPEIAEEIKRLEAAPPEEIDNCPHLREALRQDAEEHARILAESRARGHDKVYR